MEIGKQVIVNGLGYKNKEYHHKHGVVYDIAEGADRPITVEFEDGSLDCFHHVQLTFKK